MAFNNLSQRMYRAYNSLFFHVLAILQPVASLYDTFTRMGDISIERGLVNATLFIIYPIYFYSTRSKSLSLQKRYILMWGVWLVLIALALIARKIP